MVLDVGTGAMRRLTVHGPWQSTGAASHQRVAIRIILRNAYQVTECDADDIVRGGILCER